MSATSATSRNRKLYIMAIAAATAFAVIVGLSILGDATQAEPAPMVGSFTGEYVEGVPVYRLPSVNVAVSRTTELARIEREDRLAAVADSARAPALVAAAGAR